MSKIEGYQPSPIEASNQLPNGVATPTPIGPSGVGKAPTAGYGEEYFGARHDGSRFSLRAPAAREFVAFLVGEGAERVLLATRRQGARGRGMLLLDRSAPRNG